MDTFGGRSIQRPLFGNRMSGFRNRELMRDAGLEAAAVSADARPAAPPTAGFNMGVRDAGLANARNQTLMHYQLKRQAANDQFARDQAAVEQSNRDRDYVRQIAMDTVGIKMANDRLGLDRFRTMEGMGLERNALQLRRNQGNRELGLRGRDLQLRRDLADKEMGLRERQIGNQEWVEGRRLGLADSELALRRTQADRANDFQQQSLQLSKLRNQSDMGARKEELRLRNQDYQLRRDLADKEMGLRERQLGHQEWTDARRLNQADRALGQQESQTAVQMLNGYTPESVTEYQNTRDLRLLRGKQKPMGMGSTFGVLRDQGFDPTGFAGEDGQLTPAGMAYEDAWTAINADPKMAGLPVETRAGLAARAAGLPMPDDERLAALEAENAGDRWNAVMQHVPGLDFITIPSQLRTARRNKEIAQIKERKSGRTINGPTTRSASDAVLGGMDADMANETRARLNWAQANPDNPEAQKILQALGVI